MKTISIIKKNLFKHNITEKLYNQKKINDIIFNQNKRIVSIFKDYAIYNDYTEFIFMFFTKNKSIYLFNKIKKDYINIFYSIDFINYDINKIIYHYHLKINNLNHSKIKHSSHKSICIKKIIENEKLENNDFSNFLNLDLNINNELDLNVSKDIIRQLSFISSVTEELIPEKKKFLTIQSNKEKKELKKLDIINISDYLNNNKNEKIKKPQTITPITQVRLLKNQKLKNIKLVKKTNGYLSNNINQNSRNYKKNKISPSKNIKTEFNNMKQIKTLSVNNNNKKSKPISLLTESNYNENNFKRNYSNLNDVKYSSRKSYTTKENTRSNSIYSLNTQESNFRDNKFYRNFIFKLIQSECLEIDLQNKNNEQVFLNNYSSQKKQHNHKKNTFYIRKIEGKSNHKN